MGTKLIKMCFRLRECSLLCHIQISDHGTVSAHCLQDRRTCNCPQNGLIIAVIFLSDESIRQMALGGFLVNTGLVESS